MSLSGLVVETVAGFFGAYAIAMRPMNTGRLHRTQRHRPHRRSPQRGVPAGGRHQHRDRQRQSESVHPGEDLRHSHPCGRRGRRDPHAGGRLRVRGALNSENLGATACATCRDRRRSCGAPSRPLAHGLDSALSHTRSPDAEWATPRWPARSLRVAPRNRLAADQIGKSQGDGQAVAEFRAVEVELRQRHHVPHHLFDVGRTAPYLDRQRIRHLAAWIGPQPRNVSSRPEVVRG